MHELFTLSGDEKLFPGQRSQGKVTQDGGMFAELFNEWEIFAVEINSFHD